MIGRAAGFSDVDAAPAGEGARGVRAAAAALGTRPAGGGRQLRIRFASVKDTSAYGILSTPIWIFDVDRHAMWWGNPAALTFWGASGVEDLRARDFSSDSHIVRERLRLIAGAAEPDFRIEETWTLYPRSEPRPVIARVLPVLIEEGRNAILVEVTRLIDLSGDHGALRMLEAARVSPLMVSSFGADGSLLAQNPAASDTYGIDRLGNRSHSGSLAQRYRDGEMAGRLLGVIRDDAPIRADAWTATSNGPRLHRLHAARSRDPVTGDFILVITEDDITAIREAEDEARRHLAEAEARTREDARLSAARLRAAIEAIPDAFSLFDADDRLVLFNERYREVYPKHSDMLQIGRHFEEMLRVGVERGEFADAIGREEEWIAERMRRHADPQGSMEQKLSDGRWLLTEERRTPDGETVGLRVDITEQKTLQQALEHSENRFRDFAQSAADWFWEMDADLRFTYMSENIRRVIGVPQGLHYGKTRKDLVSPDHDPADWAAHEQLLRERKPFRNFEYIRVVPGLEPRWLRISGVPVFDPDGRFTGYRGSASDIHDQKLAQKRLLASEAQLFRAQKMEAVGQLTGGVAHDFNNLLAIIQGNLELIEEELEGPELKEMIGASLKAVERGARLSGQLLAFGRRAVLHPVVLDLGEQLMAMAPMIRVTVPASIDIETDFGPDCAPVALDPAKFESAVLNIVINARDAMPGGGRLTISTSSEMVSEGDLQFGGDALAPGRYSVVSVTDTGTGMCQDTQAKAFDPFFTTKPFGRGSGLGLSMVHGYVHQSGGGIVIDSELGRGTTIGLYFPASSLPAETTVLPEDVPFPQSSQGETILVAEDENDVRRAVTAHLRSLGYHVIEANDGVSALSVLKRNEFVDILLTDMVMPGALQGAELADQARVLRPDLKVVILTGLPSADTDACEHLRAGDLTLSKPVSKAILARAIWKMLND